MKKVKMNADVGIRKKGKIYDVTSRYADILVKDKQATLVEKKEKEEKAKVETKEEKAKTITKAVK